MEGWTEGCTGDGLGIDGWSDKWRDRWGMDRGMGRAVDGICSTFYLSKLCHN